MGMWGGYYTRQRESNEQIASTVELHGVCVQPTVSSYAFLELEEQEL